MRAGQKCEQLAAPYPIGEAESCYPCCVSRALDLSNLPDRDHEAEQSYRAGSPGEDTQNLRISRQVGDQSGAPAIPPCIFAIYS